MLKYLLLAFLLSIVINLYAQRKWIGGEGGSWDNPLNWEPVGVPVITDAVLLDNSREKTDYIVVLPVVPVVLHSLVISPREGNSIRVLLPNTNLASPALTLTASEDAMVLNKGGVFQNASGLTSGQSLKIAGSIRINNGGCYIHNTRSAHANDVVAKLSVAAGTEEGIFEFDIPAASSTISLSNRVFGKLKLSAATYNGNLSYSGGGSNPVTIRSDLEITPRVSFSIGFSNTFLIKRHLLQTGGVFNISNDNNASMVAVGGDLLQTSGTITETGSAQPVLLLNGVSRQQLLLSGGITNDVIIRADNPSTIELKSSVTLPYRLELKQGIIKTTNESLLTLSGKCELQANPLSTCFIDGPLRKQGLIALTNFVFPVGKANNQRWLALKNVTGSFTVSFHQENPYTYASVMGDGLDHISSLEYWTIDSGSEPAQAHVELSFDNLHSGGVTDLQTLRVAQLEPGVKWRSRGNTATSGSAGAAGSVTSEMISDFTESSAVFTLASSVSQHNILPQWDIYLSGSKEGEVIKLHWQPVPDLPAAYYIVESSADKLKFNAVRKIGASRNDQRLSITYYPLFNERYFRVKLVTREGIVYPSRIIYVGHDISGQFSISRIASKELQVRLNNDRAEEGVLTIYDKTGRMVFKSRETLVKGDNTFTFPLVAIAPGLYVVRLVTRSAALSKKIIL